MKSSSEALQTRGFLSEADFLKQSSGEFLDLRKALLSTDAVLRTATIRSIHRSGRKDLIRQLCILLETEKALYTKIEVCHCLADFGNLAIENLIPLLGKIGRNQHRSVANIDLNKPSYPLPRDIVARILIRMGTVVFAYLRPLLGSLPTKALSEAIDVIGHISYFSKDQSLEEDLWSLYVGQPNDLLQWKLIRAFRSFHSERIVNELAALAEDAGLPQIIRNEARRSLSPLRRIH